MAHVKSGGGPMVGKYAVNLMDLEEIGVQAIVEAVGMCDVVVIDEVGPMELKSTRFKKAVENALASTKSILGTIHRSASDPLVKRIKDNSIQLFEVTYANREILADRIEREVNLKVE